MNERDRRNMAGPSWDTTLCPFCGDTAKNRHHIVPRSRGGGAGPTITVCGMGNASGCHGLIHAGRLHLRWTGRWEFLLADTPCSDGEAERMQGWAPVTDMDGCMEL